MLLKDREQSTSRMRWHHRRVHRCLAFAIVLLLVLTLGLFRHDSWSVVTDLSLDNLPGLQQHTHKSESDAAGTPSLLSDNVVPPKTSDQPFVKIPGTGVDEQPEDEDIQDLTSQVPGQDLHDEVSSFIPPAEDEVSEDKDTTSKEESTSKDHSINSKLQSEEKPIAADLMLDPSKVALLLETRPLPHLPALLSHFISVLPPAWTFRFVGSLESLALIQSSYALSNPIGTGKLVLDLLPEEYKIDSQEAISNTLTNLSFYKEFLKPAEWVLMFQSDSIVCAGSEHSIDEWVDQQFTWVGAPWNMDVPGGNGGLSLRHIPPIIKLLEREQRQPNSSQWEDLWLCDRLMVLEGTNMAPPEIEKQFSVEGLWTDRPFGYHLRGSGKLLVDEVWSDPAKRQEMFDYCPEIKIILNMDLSTKIDKMQTEIDDLKKKINGTLATIAGVSNKETAEALQEKLTGGS